MLNLNLTCHLALAQAGQNLVFIKFIDPEILKQVQDDTFRLKTPKIGDDEIWYFAQV